MAQLPTFRRFNIADYPTADSWLDDLFDPLNLFCEQTVSALNKNLSLNGNVQGMKYSATFTTPSTYATGGFNNIVFNYTGGGQPNCAIVGQISRSDGAKILTPVTITDWALNLNTTPYQVNIRYIAGLDAATQYSINILVI